VRDAGEAQGVQSRNKTHVLDPDRVEHTVSGFGASGRADIIECHSEAPVAVGKGSVVINGELERNDVPSLAT
jgi:hypothetical protein